MPRYLIEVNHENKKEACDLAVHAFLATGSHFMTHADWGCGDAVHKAWFIAELDSKEEAMRILPPLFRENAKVIALKRFSMGTLDETRDQHKD